MRSLAMFWKGVIWLRTYNSYSALQNSHNTNSFFNRFNENNSDAVCKI